MNVTVGTFYLDGAEVNVEVEDPYTMVPQTFTTSGSHSVTTRSCTAMAPQTH
jgi:hypothetical protein